MTTDTPKKPSNKGQTTWQSPLGTAPLSISSEESDVLFALALK